MRSGRQDCFRKASCIMCYDVRRILPNTVDESIKKYNLTSTSTTPSAEGVQNILSKILKCIMVKVEVEAKVQIYRGFINVAASYYPAEIWIIAFLGEWTPLPTCCYILHSLTHRCKEAFTF